GSQSRRLGPQRVCLIGSAKSGRCGPYRQRRPSPARRARLNILNSNSPRSKGLGRTAAMKLGVNPENLAERLALWIGMPPPGIIESWLGIMASRAVMAATKLNIFEALAAGALTAQELAKQCATHPRATEQLLNALVGMG